MLQQPNAKLCQLIERDKRDDPPVNASIAPTIDDAGSTVEDTPLPTPFNNPIDDDAVYEGLDWQRVPHLEKRQKEHAKGAPSWIYRYGWPVYHRFKQRNYWLCRYCHQYRKAGGEYDAGSTSAAAVHLAKRVAGHSVSAAGPLTRNRDPNQGTLIGLMRESGIEVSQGVANEISASFRKRRFLDALKDWIAADNQSLRVIETPTFRRMIEAANPLAEAVLWRNHQSLRDAIIAEYHSYVPIVTDYLSDARSLIHVSFDNWTSTGGKRGLTSICVHMMDASGELQDFVLGLPELHGQHSGENIGTVVATTLTNFGVTQDSVGYFVLNNAYNNNTAVAYLAKLYGFEAPERRLRCCCHILNLGAQVIIWGKDREAYENDGANLEDEEAFMKEWRQYGPIGVLFNIIASICTPQTRQLLQSFQQSEAASLGKVVELKELVKPIKMRWNSYYATFARAVELQGPLDAYVDMKLNENRHAEVVARRSRRPGGREQPQARLFLREGGLHAGNWATINEYIKLLAPFAEATKLLEGRGKHGRHGAIWEVLITFEWLLDELEALKDRLKDVDYNDLAAPEDHLQLNVNLAYQKLSLYYAKFDDAPVYYAATILHPHYKHHLKALWKVPDDHNAQRDGPHYRDGWLTNNHRAFLVMWKGYRDATAASGSTSGATSSATSEGHERPPKKPRIAEPTASRSAFLKLQLDAAVKQVEEHLGDEYEQWKRLPAIAEDDPMAYNPLRYWQLQSRQYPLLSKFALNVLTIPASAADCERTFSELGDMLGTRRLRMKPELINALQCLKSWRRLKLKTPKGGHTIDEIVAIQAYLRKYDPI